MSEMQAPAPIELQWDVADRLRKSLRASGVSVGDMADYLEVHRNSVGAWLNDRTRPDHRTLMLWAMRTGVPLPWLEHGESPDDAERARRYSKPQPSDPKSDPPIFHLVRAA